MKNNFTTSLITLMIVVQYQSQSCQETKHFDKNEKYESIFFETTIAELKEI